MDLFKKLFKKYKDTKSVFPNQEHIIEWAFNVGGTDYYCFGDVFSLPYERGLMAVAIYNELDMRIGRPYLEKHTEAMDKILSEQTIDVFKIKILNEQIKQRMSLVTDVDLLYKIASVVFFDKNENPALYEANYCEKKIQHWKSSRGVADFFLQKPLMELIPFLDNVDVNLDSYSVLNYALNELHLDKIRTLLSKK